jgi:Flp pilus assembly protein TadB
VIGSYGPLARIDSTFRDRECASTWRKATKHGMTRRPYMALFLVYVALALILALLLRSWLSVLFGVVGAVLGVAKVWTIDRRNEH